MIKLKRCATILEIEPWQSWIGPMCEYTRREMDYSFKGIGKAKMHKETLWKRNPETNNGYVPGGMHSRIEAELKKRDLPYELVDFRDIKRLMPDPDYTQVDSLRPGQEKVLIAVATKFEGLIVGGTGMGKSFLIVQICKMYPSLRIIVCSPRTSVVQTLYERLAACMPANALGQIGAGRNDSPKKRITVCTTRSLIKADLERCDLLLFDEAHNVGYNQVAEDVAKIINARKFGFTATPGGRSDGADKVMEALFGPVLIDIPYDEAEEAGLVTPIEVEIYPVPPAPHSSYQSDMPVAMKRHHYWRNKERNGLIAQIANQVPQDEQLLIMVETLEHAILLKKMLPDFELAYYGKPDDRAVKMAGDLHLHTSPKKLAETRKKFESMELMRVISTGVFKEGVDFRNLSVLIRADGASSPIASAQIPGRLSRLAEGKTRGVLIDFSDTFNKWAEGRAQKRIATYRKTKWKITYQN